MQGSGQDILWSILFNHRNNHRLEKLPPFTHQETRAGRRRNSEDHSWEWWSLSDGGQSGCRVLLKDDKFSFRCVKFEVVLDKADQIYKVHRAHDSR